MNPFKSNLRYNTALGFPVLFRHLVPTQARFGLGSMDLRSYHQQSELGQ